MTIEELNALAKLILLDIECVVKLPSKYDNAINAEGFQAFQELCKKYDLPYAKKNYIDSKGKVIKAVLDSWFAKSDDDNDTDEMFNILNDIIRSNKKIAIEQNNKEQVKLFKLISDSILKNFNSHKTIESHEERIKTLLQVELLKKGQDISKDDITIVTNEAETANKVFKVTINKENGSDYYYVKTFSNDSLLSSGGLISPNELLVYKIMEYTEFGPEVLFLIRDGSSSNKSTGSTHEGNYIVTRDLAYEGKFLLDTLDKAEDIKLLIDQHLEKFAIEIESAAAMRDILSLSDTFNMNGFNYGLLSTNDSLKVQFIDHLPNTNNGILSKLLHENPEKIKQYSPRLRLDQEFTSKFQVDTTKIKSPLVDFAVSTREEYTKVTLQKDVKARLFEPEVTDKHMNLNEAMKQAQKEIQILIDAHESNFIDQSSVGTNSLNSYIEKINKNVQTFCISMDYDYDTLVNSTNFEEVKFVGETEFDA